MNRISDVKRRSAILSLILVLFFLVLYACLHTSLVKAQGGKRQSSANSAEISVYLPLIINKQFSLLPGEYALDGVWMGDSVTDGFPSEINPVTFSVEAGGKRIASGAKINTYYKESSGLWTCYGTSMWTVNESIPINSDGTFYISGGILNKLTWEGRFSAPNQVEGTFHTEIFVSLCGTVINDGTWSATWQGP